MGESSKISWTQATWNPWQGCERVSPGCDNCYADRQMAFYGRTFRPRRSRDRTFNGPLRWRPSLIFTCSWSDFFLAEADAWRPEAWEIIERTPHHIYQVLTKRTPRMRDWARVHGWPDHVWAGTSVESRTYLHRVDVLRDVPAAVRFLSMEPLLEDIGELDLSGIKLVIAGGESGPGWRPLELGWVRSIRDQCLDQGVTFHFKQAAGQRPPALPELDGVVWSGLPTAADSLLAERIS